LTQAWDFSTGTITSNTTLYAKWLATKTVTLNTDGGEAINPIEGIPQGFTTTLPTPVRTGYTFNGWFTQLNGQGIQYISETTPVTDDITLYASWTINQYTITFNSDGGSAIDPDTIPVDYNTSLGAQMPADPTRTGCTFDGWYSARQGSGTVFTSNTAVTGSITVYAKWLTDQYTISFDTDGGSDDPSSATAVYDAAITMPAEPIRTGYVFKGWYTDKNGQGTEFTASTHVTGNTMLYAFWAAKRSVSFYELWGETTARATVSDVVAGTVFGDINAPVVTKDGYGFAGWYTMTDPDEDGEYTFDVIHTSSTVIAFDTSTEEDLSLYPKWKQLYTVTFKDGDDDYDTAKTTADSDCVALPSNPAKENYKFAGWYINSDFSGEKFTSASAVIEDMNVYARWIPKGVWSGDTAEAFGGGTGTEADPYKITTPEELAFLAQEAGQGRSGGYYIQTGDFDMNGDNYNWTQINNFNGTYDGKGHTISNLKINTTQLNVGLFSELGSYRTIKNLNVSGTYYCGAVMGGIYARIGGIAGINNGYIINCNSAVNISTLNTTNAFIGGIAGGNLGLINKCSSSGTLAGNTYTGGITGGNNSNYSVIINSWNTGSISGSGRLGGIAGISSSTIDMSSLNSSGKINNCYNTGSITADAAGTVYIGGIVGELGVTGINLSGNSLLLNCYSSGNLNTNSNGSAVKGGIAGISIDSATNRNIATMRHCYWLFGTAATSSGTGAADVENVSDMTLANDTFVNILNLNKNAYYLDDNLTWIRDSNDVVNSGLPYLDRQ